MRSEDAASPVVPGVAPNVAPNVAIVGAGFSGTVLAAELTRLGVAVTLVEQSDRFAEGLAYSTRRPEHVLNVPASNMSAFADEPDHFARWLAARDGGEAGSFAPRMVYAEYLCEVMESIDPQPGRIVGQAIGVARTGLLLDHGRAIAADAVVIAAGNLRPEPAAMFGDGKLRYLADPWTADSREAFVELAAQRADILILGTGLTMIDTVLALDASGFEGRTVAISRRGLLPRAHAPVTPTVVPPPPSLRLAALLRWVRAQSRSHEWRRVIDSLRPISATIWHGWTIAERSRFLRHTRPWWDVHRHRIAPHVADRLADLTARGRLVINAGRLTNVTPEVLRVRSRGSGTETELAPACVINCTGPQGDIRRSGNPLVRSLLESGVARTDPFGLGLVVDADGRVVAGEGVQAPPLYAIGPMTRGTFWERVAVPDIRVQAASLARRIAADLEVASAATRRAMQ